MGQKLISLLIQHVEIFIIKETYVIIMFLRKMRYERFMRGSILHHNTSYDEKVEKFIWNDLLSLNMFESISLL